MPGGYYTKIICENGCIDKTIHETTKGERIAKGKLNKSVVSYSCRGYALRAGADVMEEAPEQIQAPLGRMLVLPARKPARQGGEAAAADAAGQAVRYQALRIDINEAGNDAKGHKGETAPRESRQEPILPIEQLRYSYLYAVDG